MDYEMNANIQAQQMNEKLAAMANQVPTPYGMAQGSMPGTPCRENLRGRLHAQLARIDRSMEKRQNTCELLALLEKNPDVARILELVESLGA